MKGDDSSVAVLPREAVDGQWDEVIPDEPAGGVDFRGDEVSEPPRDVDEVTEVLAGVEQGDRVRLTIGVEDAYFVAVLLVVSREGGERFDHKVTFIERPQDDGWTRMYMTGVGNEDLDAWEVVSFPYRLSDGTADVRDLAGNGWIVDAEVTDDDVSPRPGDRDV